MNLDPGILASVVARCCAIKAEVVGQDEKEGGYRAILNFGHTIGHAIENSVGYGRFLHGEAISIGQVAASHLSHSLLGFPQSDVERVRSLFKAAGLPVQMPMSPVRRKKLLAAMKLDKKVSAGQVKFVLAKAIGEVATGQNVADRELHQALRMIEKKRQVTVWLNGFKQFLARLIQNWSLRFWNFGACGASSRTSARRGLARSDFVG